MTAFAKMQQTGVSIDTELLAAMRRNRQAIQLDLISAIDKRFNVFDGTTFKDGLSAGYLYDHRMEWPRTPSCALTNRALRKW